jgi:hypothetical protein
MKSKPVKKKQTLKLKIDEGVNYKLIGISSHENDYRLVWSINNQLKMQFVRIENLVVHNRKLKADLEFSRFTYHDEERCMKYYLVSNRCPDGFLFPEIKNFDFLLQIVGEFADKETQALSRKIKTVDVISASFVLQPDKLKGIGKILQE